MDMFLNVCCLKHDILVQKSARFVDTYICDKVKKYVVYVYIAMPLLSVVISRYVYKYISDLLSILSDVHVFGNVFHEANRISYLKFLSSILGFVCDKIAAFPLVKVVAKGGISAVGFKSI